MPAERMKISTREPSTKTILLNPAWHSYKNYDGYTNYNLVVATDLTGPMDYNQTDSLHRFREFVTDADVNLEFNEEYRYTTPYRVKVEYSSGIIEKWASSIEKNHTEVQPVEAELAYLNVDFANKDDAKKFQQKAKRILERMATEDSTRYQRPDAIPLIEERARTQAWGDEQTGTEARVAKALGIVKYGGSYEPIGAVRE